MKHCYNKIEGWCNDAILKTYIKMVNETADNAHFVEVGAYLGKSTSFMVVEIQNSNKNIKFDVVDTWKGNTHWSNETKNKIKGDLFEQFKLNMDKFNLTEYLNPIRMTSIEASKNYENVTLDFVFIDANHTYEDVLGDINAWFPKIKYGGFIGGHDYSQSFVGVKKAVNEFFGKEIKVVGTNCWLHNKQPVYYI